MKIFEINSRNELLGQLRHTDPNESLLDKIDIDSKVVKPAIVWQQGLDTLVELSKILDEKQFVDLLKDQLGKLKMLLNDIDEYINTIDSLIHYPDSDLEDRKEKANRVKRQLVDNVKNTFGVTG